MNPCCLCADHSRAREHEPGVHTQRSLLPRALLEPQTAINLYVSIGVSHPYEIPLPKKYGCRRVLSILNYGRQNKGCMHTLHLHQRLHRVFAVTLCGAMTAQ